MRTLAEFIEEKIAIAKDYRNLTATNPVELVIEDEYKNKYIILVSSFEPDTATVPFNVTWINSDPDHPHYKTVQRRVDAFNYDTDSGYKYSWSVLATVEEIFAEEQYWNNNSGAILGEIDKFGLLPATTERTGIFKLTEENGEGTTAISTNDPRMFDARDPIEHMHGVYPVTMFAAGNVETAELDGEGNPVLAPCVVYTANNTPKLGDIFVVTSISADGTEAIGQWQPPENEFVYAGPLPAELTVVGPVDIIDSLTNHVLRANVRMDDGEILTSVDATWVVLTNNAFGRVGANTGVFQALGVEAETTVRVQATWVHPDSGVSISNFIDITIRDASGVLRLIGIAIVGPASINKSEPTQYTVEASFNDGSVVPVTPNTFVSSNSAAGTFVSGLLTPYLSQMFDKTTTLSASYMATGVTRTATLNVTVVDDAVYPQSAAIIGAASLEFSEVESYTLNVTYTDGSVVERPAASWAMIAETYATIDEFGVLTAKALESAGDKTATIRATYSEAGVDLTATKPITILDPTNYPVSAAILGPDTVAGNQTATYEMEVTYKDGSKVIRTPSIWNSADAAKATIDAAGLFSPQTFSATTVVISAAYTELGVSLTPEKTIGITEVTFPLIRFGTARFANTQFTGGILEPLTPQQIQYGVTNANTPQGEQYTHWDGVQDFFDTQMVHTMPITGGDTNLILGVDEYLYIAYDPQIGNLSFIDLTNNFPVQFDGVNWPDDILVPPENPPATFLDVNVMIDGQMQTMRVLRTDFGGIATAQYRVTVTR